MIEQIENENKVLDRVRIGVQKILELHSNEELKILVHNFRKSEKLCLQQMEKQYNEETLPGKRRVILLNLLIKDGGVKLKEYRKILDSIWPGILLEYLKLEGISIRKVVNLKQTENISKVVFQFWQKDLVQTDSTDVEFEYSPSFALETLWSQLHTRNLNLENKIEFETDLPSTNTIQRINTALNKLAEEEKSMKISERLIRENPTCENVITFFKKFTNLREIENDLRNLALPCIEKSLKTADFHYTQKNHYCKQLDKEVEKLKTEKIIVISKNKVLSNILLAGLHRWSRLKEENETLAEESRKLSEQLSKTKESNEQIKTERDKHYEQMRHFRSENLAKTHELKMMASTIENLETVNIQLNNCLKKSAQEREKMERTIAKQELELVQNICAERVLSNPERYMLALKAGVEKAVLHQKSDIAPSETKVITKPKKTATKVVKKSAQIQVKASAGNNKGNKTRSLKPSENLQGRKKVSK